MSSKSFSTGESQQLMSHCDALVDIKPDVTLLGQTVPGLSPADGDDTYESDSQRGHITTEDETNEKKPEKKTKKGSKKVGIKGVKQSATGSDDSFTMGMLSTGKGQCKLQAGHLTPSLLEEVLNDKKRALLRSPEVIQTLLQLQAQVQEGKEAQIEEKTAQATGKANHAPKEVPQRPGPTRKSPANTAKQNQSIWSKEGSAFTSVTSSNT